LSLVTRIPFQALADMDWRLLHTYEDAVAEMKEGGEDGHR
jgi:hypothetical protein